MGKGDIMEIGSMSIGMHQASAQSDVQLSVLKMAMNQSEKVSIEMTDMMENMAVEEYKGANIDIRV